MAPDSNLLHNCSLKPQTTWNFTKENAEKNNVYTKFKHVSIHPRGSKPKPKIKQKEKKLFIEMKSQIFYELLVLASESYKNIFLRYQKYEFFKIFWEFLGKTSHPIKIFIPDCNSQFFLAFFCIVFKKTLRGLETCFKYA